MKTIKKIVCLFLLVTTISVFAQESTLLRYNFNKGDKYAVEMTIKQKMGTFMNMDIALNMQMESVGKEKENYMTTYKFERMAMNMVSAGNEVKFDSDMKDEEMGEDAKKMKAEMAPFFDMLIHQTMNKYGKIVGMKFVPEIKGADQFLAQSQFTSMEYPKEAVKVGSEWSHSQSVNGMSMEGTYVVKRITKGVVFADFLGKMESGAEGKMTGTVEIDRTSGMIIDMKLNMDASAGGIEMEMIMQMKSKKVN